MTSTRTVRSEFIFPRDTQRRGHAARGPLRHYARLVAALQKPGEELRTDLPLEVLDGPVTALGLDLTGRLVLDIH